ncbi:MAG: hypothetical protein ABEI58_01570 [Candidatus Nanohaloarchaea archaeon]
MKCEVCGRTEDELDDEFGIDIEFKEHQGLKKCSKCIREYESELGADEQVDESEPVDATDWKDRITA